MDYKDELEKYEKIDKVGEGTYGVVYKAKDQKGNEIYGVSQIATPFMFLSYQINKRYCLRT